MAYEEQGNSDIVAERKVALSAPTSDRSDLRRSFVLSTLHTASVTFPFVTSIVYWLLLHPSESIFDHGGKGGKFDNFVLISTTVLNSAIAFVEVMVLSSVRKQKVFSLPCVRNICLKSIGPGYPSSWCHRYLLLLRNVDGHRPFHHWRVRI